MADIMEARDEADDESRKMSFGPMKGADGNKLNTIDKADPNYRLDGNLPAPVGRGTVAKPFKVDQQAYNNYFAEKPVDVTDGRERGLTKIKNILQAFETESAF